MPIVAKIREYCEKKHIPISRFEEKCGLGNGMVSKWENGVCFPTIVSLIKIERGTGIKLRTWLKGYEEWEI